MKTRTVTKKQVEKIKQLLKLKIPQRTIGDMVGASQYVVYLVKTGKYDARRCLATKEKEIMESNPLFCWYKHGPLISPIEFYQL